MHEISMVPVCLPEQPSFRAALRVPILPVTHAGIPKPAPAETCSQRTASTRSLAGQTGAADTHDHGARHGGRQGTAASSRARAPGPDWPTGRAASFLVLQLQARALSQPDSPVSWGQWQSITTAEIQIKPFD